MTEIFQSCDCASDIAQAVVTSRAGGICYSRTARGHHLTIRDLLWLTLVVALAVGWWLDRSQVAKQLDAAHSQLSDAKLEAQVEALKQQFAQRGFRIKTKNSGSPQKQPDG
jgi:hypothetical protein